MDKKTALITGITGQDGSYLAELLLDKGYRVVGTTRPIEKCQNVAPLNSGLMSSSESVYPKKSFGNIQKIQNLLEIIPADLSDFSSICKLLETIRPDEIYNLAAQTFVPSGQSAPLEMSQATGMNVLVLLNALETVLPHARFCHASSSEIYGNSQTERQNEATPHLPRSLYGVAKSFAHMATKNYRENKNVFACSGILFNHESPRRGTQFVTRKISLAVARIALGIDNHITLGNIDSQRDWGFAGDYVEALWRMLQQDRPNDFVIATGELHSVRDFLEIAFDYVGLKAERFVRIDPSLFRPSEQAPLCGDISKAKSLLGWAPSMNFHTLVELMVKTDLEYCQSFNQKVVNQN